MFQLERHPVLSFKGKHRSVDNDQTTWSEGSRYQPMTLMDGWLDGWRSKIFHTLRITKDPPIRRGEFEPVFRRSAFWGPQKIATGLRGFQILRAIFLSGQSRRGGQVSTSKTLGT